MFPTLQPRTVGRPDGTRVALITAQPDGEPRGTVLCLHGFTGGKEDFMFLLPELASSGFVAAAMDSRGVNDSESVGPYDLVTLAADVAAVAAALSQDPVDLVAHSFGGLVAQRAVVADPDRFASLTLVCSGPAGFRSSAELIPITIERVTAFQHLLAEHDLDDAWDLKTAYENVEMHESMAGFLKSRFVAGSHAAAVRNIADALDAPDVVDQVAAAGVPCHVMYGEHDGTWAQSTQNDMARRLGTTPVAVPDSTHLPFLENVDAFVAAYVQQLAAQ